MFDSILALFRTQNEASATPITLELAAAALLVEVMAADDEWHAVEQAHIQQLLSDTLQIDSAAAQQLFNAAKHQQQSAHDLFEVTQLINHHYSAEQKYQLVLNMWKVAYADGNIDRYEDYMIRKIAELLYLPHAQFIQAKLAAHSE